MAHFLPARVEQSRGEPEVSVLPWQGSGDVVTMARANAFLVVPPEKAGLGGGGMGAGAAAARAGRRCDSDGLAIDEEGDDD